MTADPKIKKELQIGVISPPNRQPFFRIAYGIFEVEGSGDTAFVTNLSNAALLTLIVIFAGASLMSILPFLLPIFV